MFSPLAEITPVTAIFTFSASEIPRVCNIVLYLILNSISPIEKMESVMDSVWDDYPNADLINFELDSKRSLWSRTYRWEFL